MFCSTADATTCVAALLIISFSARVAGRESTLSPGLHLRRETLRFGVEGVRYAVTHTERRKAQVAHSL